MYFQRRAQQVAKYRLREHAEHAHTNGVSNEWYGTATDSHMAQTSQQHICVQKKKTVRMGITRCTCIYEDVHVKWAQVAHKSDELLL